MSDKPTTATILEQMEDVSSGIDRLQAALTAANLRIGERDTLTRQLEQERALVALLTPSVTP